MTEERRPTQRVQLELAYVLHHRPYRDTSRILDLLTRHYGRVTAFARGVRGGRKGAASFGSLLQPFNRLLVSWHSRSDAGQLTGAESDGPMTSLPDAHWASGFYMNELLLTLLTHQDSQPPVFDLYAAALEALKAGAEPAVILRVFEKRLLEAVGYGLALEHEALSNAPIESDRVYRYQPSRGAVRIEGVAEGSLIFSGASLLALAREDLSEAATRSDARRLLRAALDACLEGRSLQSRRVLAAVRGGVRKTNPPDGSVTE
jgi:DNA repair protein RecO (recombination protein O)